MAAAGTSGVRKGGRERCTVTWMLCQSSFCCCCVSRAEEDAPCNKTTAKKIYVSGFCTRKGSNYRPLHSYSHFYLFFFFPFFSLFFVYEFNNISSKISVPTSVYVGTYLYESVMHESLCLSLPFHVCIHWFLRASHSFSLSLLQLIICLLICSPYFLLSPYICLYICFLL